MARVPGLLGSYPEPSQLIGSQLRASYFSKEAKKGAESVKKGNSL